ncbi:hypothetical protein TNCV_3781211 [Trichonephila clavipes]|nr:hypothetical protein TNCV_3781211 [Trichonephila clavipes]
MLTISSSGDNSGLAVETSSPTSTDLVLLPMLPWDGVPRCVIPKEFKGYYSVHPFSDASSSSYACVVYLRREGKNGVNIQLLQAKSRVAPLQKTTAPRLELLHWCSS